MCYYDRIMILCANNNIFKKNSITITNLFSFHDGTHLCPVFESDVVLDGRHLVQHVGLRLGRGLRNRQQQLGQHDESLVGKG